MGEIGSPGRTRTANLVVTSAPEFLLGLDYLFTRPKLLGLGCRALPPDNVWRTSRSSSLCTFPEKHRFRTWLRVTILRFRQRVGSLEFTRFFNHDFSWKLQFGVNLRVICTEQDTLIEFLSAQPLLNILFCLGKCDYHPSQFIFLQPPALPIELPGSKKSII